MAVIHRSSIIRDFPLRWVEIAIGSMLDFGQIVEMGSISTDPTLRD
jgi:hypothetical protein